MDIVEAIAIVAIAVTVMIQFFNLHRIEDKVDRLLAARTPPLTPPRAFRRDLDED